MSQLSLVNGEAAAISRKRGGVQRVIKHSLKIDMTPMVDLGFLLISFFVITAELSKPTAMDLYMPKDGPPMPLGESNALTLLLEKDNTIYYYNGDWKDAVKTGNINKINFSGANSLRNIIKEKQKQLDASSKSKEGGNGLMLLIKPGSGASYKNVVEALDEGTINMVKKYALMKISADEVNWLKGKSN